MHAVVRHCPGPLLKLYMLCTWQRAPPPGRLKITHLTRYPYICDLHRQWGLDPHATLTRFSRARRTSYGVPRTRTVCRGTIRGRWAAGRDQLIVYLQLIQAYKVHCTSIWRRSDGGWCTETRTGTSRSTSMEYSVELE